MPRRRHLETYMHPDQNTSDTQEKQSILFFSGSHLPSSVSVAARRCFLMETQTVANYTPSNLIGRLGESPDYLLPSGPGSRPLGSQLLLKPRAESLGPLRLRLRAWHDFARD